MVEVDLFTEQGELVVTVIFAYNPRPKVIQWDERMFLLKIDENLEPRYEEVSWLRAVNER